MRKLYIVGLVVAVALTFGIVYADQMVFSTYYPAPFGVYREMRIMRAAIGETYHKAGDYPWNETGLGGPGEIDEWVDLLVEGHVGLGTTEPIANLDIYYPTGAIGLRVLGQTNALFRLQSDEPGGKFLDIEPDTEGATIELDDIDIMSLDYNMRGVGIGLTDPQTRLNVRGELLLGERSTAAFSGLPFSIGAGKNALWFGDYNGFIANDYGLIYGQQTGKVYRLNILSGDNREGTPTEDDEVFIGNVDHSTLDKEGLIVKAGNVGIGTVTPTTDANPKGHDTGNLDVNDVWLRDAGSSGAWASQGGSGPDFESTERVITPGQVSAVHGLGAVPKLFVVVARNKNAAHGYSPGDEMLYDPSGSGQDAGPRGLWADSTSVGISGNGAIKVQNKTTGVAADGNPANWRLVFRAWR